MLVLPFCFYDAASYYDCCHDEIETALFSPEHSLTITVIIILCLLAYYFSVHRIHLSTAIVEVVVNILLITGIGLNVLIAMQTNSVWLPLVGNLPIILLFILALAKNQLLFIEYAHRIDFASNSKIKTLAWNILKLQPIIKYPVLFILCLPLLTIISLLLLLFGQKPDSFIRAFTETYNRGFSQLNNTCADVPCEGHYLCTVAAKGHKQIVKPQRLGVRYEQVVVCNRQLLVSNAFEDLLQEKIPSVHKFIRKQYNKVGHFIHRYYGVFNIKLVSDLIYVLMKPLEWFFLLTLYTVDKRPENRIAKQYLSKADRWIIDDIERRTT